MEYKEWRLTATIQCARIFAIEPEKIRWTIDSIRTKRSEFQRNGEMAPGLGVLRDEVRMAVEDYGLDPMWLDYVKAHISKD